MNGSLPSQVVESFDAVGVQRWDASFCMIRRWRWNERGRGCSASVAALAFLCCLLV